MRTFFEPGNLKKGGVVMKKKKLQNEDRNSILDGYRLKINKNPALVQKGRDKYLIFFRPSDSSLQRGDVESVLRVAQNAKMCIGYNLDLFHEGVIAIYFNPLLQEQTTMENVSKDILDSILKDRAETPYLRYWQNSMLKQKYKKA